jgi:hypothetical protein
MFYVLIYLDYKRDPLLITRQMGFLLDSASLLSRPHAGRWERVREKSRDQS